MLLPSHGDGNLKVDKPVVSVGGEVTLTGPAGAEVEISWPGQKPPLTVTLDATGKAKLPANGPPRVITMWLRDDPSSSEEVEIIDAV